MENITIQNSDNNSVIITIANQLNIDNVVDAKNELSALIEKFNIFNFYLLEIDSIDVAGIQLLYSYKTELLKKGKYFNLKCQFNENTQNLLKTTGFENLINENF